MKPLFTISSLVIGLLFCHTGLAAVASHATAQAGVIVLASTDQGKPDSGQTQEQGKKKETQGDKKEENPEDDCE